MLINVKVSSFMGFLTFVGLIDYVEHEKVYKLRDQAYRSAHILLNFIRGVWEKR